MLREGVSVDFGVNIDVVDAVNVDEVDRVETSGVVAAVKRQLLLGFDPWTNHRPILVDFVATFLASHVASVNVDERHDGGSEDDGDAAEDVA